MNPGACTVFSVDFIPNGFRTAEEGEEMTVPVFMPVPFEVHPGDACLVVFADIDIDAWFDTGEASVPRSARRHSLSDGFAFVGWKAGGSS